jgi:general stress protein 26
MAKKDDKDGGREVRRLRKFIRGSRVAMLTTVGADGHLRSRPMATVKAAFDGNLWFFTKASAPKTSEIRDNAHVNVVYADPEDRRFVSVSGRAALVRDPAQVEQLWSGRLKAWFPEGKKDPDLALIRVRIDHAEYWDSKKGTMVQAVGLMAALSAEGGTAAAPTPRPAPAAAEKPGGTTPPASPGAAG